MHERRNARRPQRSGHPTRSRPSERDDEQITTPALPQIQRMPFPNPRHAERIRPIGEQVHEAAAGEAERGSGKRAGRMERAIRENERRRPAHPSMSGRSMRDPQPPRTAPPRDFHPIGRGTTGHARRERDEATRMPRPSRPGLGHKHCRDQSGSPARRVMCAVRCHTVDASAIRHRRDGIVAEGRYGERKRL